jgi:hypothetical protein
VPPVETPLNGAARFAVAVANQGCSRSGNPKGTSAGVEGRSLATGAASIDILLLRKQVQRTRVGSTALIRTRQAFLLRLDAGNLDELGRGVARVAHFRP